jgi:hypothetical protein
VDGAQGNYQCTATQCAGAAGSATCAPLRSSCRVCEGRCLNGTTCIAGVTPTPGGIVTPTPGGILVPGGTVAPGAGLVSQ